MMGKTHLSGGLAFGLLATQFNIINYIPALEEVSNNPMQVGVLIAGSMIGSLLVDVDHPNSLAGRKLKPIAWLMGGLSKMFNKMSIDKASKSFAHRGITHSLLVWMITLALFIVGIGALDLTDFTVIIGVYFIFGILVGALSHLFLDSLTVSGTPMLLPITFKRFRLLKLTTGGSAEQVVHFLIYGVILFSIKGILF